MRLLTPFIRRRRKGRWCHRGEMVGREWSSKMLMFQGEEYKGHAYFGKGKEHTWHLLVPAWRGDWRMQ
jgi:1,4-alpha-glucan branching enzyme